MRNFINLETYRKRKGKNQAKISLKNEKLSLFFNVYGRRDMEGIWNFEGLETTEVRDMDAINKIFVCA